VDARVEVPVFGRIAAGMPITAVQHIEDTMVLLRVLVGSGELFLLTVHGDSMTGAAGILDGDLVAVRRQPSAEHGDIVVALLDGEWPRGTARTRMHATSSNRP
jgi:repressor LexA